jgi:HJR/Mrr/RecB family endonuclease
VTHVLGLITRLKQICNLCPETGSSAKLDDLSERLDTLRAEGNRMLVFTQFTDDRYGAQAIARRLSMHAPLLFTGSMSQDERTRCIRKFKEDDHYGLLVLSLRVGGQGLNLQEASYVAHFDRWWNPAIEHQAEDRSHRMGQTVPVDVYTYTMAGTIEERIAQLLEEKQRLFDFLVDEVSIDLDRVLSADELFGLFGLRPPRKEGPLSHAKAGTTDYGSMTGREFELYVARVMRGMGWQVETTPASRDGGVDLIAHKEDELGLEVTTLYVQCKNYAQAVSVEPVRAIVGVLPASESTARAAVVCPSGFTADARRFGEERAVVLVDADGLREWERLGQGGDVT